MLRGAQSPVAFNIGDAAKDREVVFLHRLYKFFKIIPILGAVFLIAIIDFDTDGINGIHAGTTHITTADILRHKLEHSDFSEQVFRTFIKLQKTADLVFAEVGIGHQQFSAFGVVLHLKGLSHGGYHVFDQRMFVDIFHFFAQNVSGRVQFAQ